MKQKNVSRHHRAVVRNELWQSLGPAEQLASLNERRPDGAKKQKAKLEKKLAV